MKKTKIVLGKDLRETFELTFGVKWDGQRNLALANQLMRTNGSYEGQYSRTFRQAQLSRGELYSFIAHDILVRTRINSGTCLDVGCGAGRLAYEVSKIFKGQVIGIDPAAEAINLANQDYKAQNLEFRTAGVEDICNIFPSNSLDLIFSRNALYFVADPVKALKDMHQVLKPNGQIYIQLINKDKEELLMEDLAKKAKKDPEIALLNMMGCPVLWRVNEFEHVLDQTGLKYLLYPNPFRGLVLIQSRITQKIAPVLDMGMVATIKKN